MKENEDKGGSDILTTLYKYSHYRQDRVLESDGVDAALPLGHGAVHVDGARLGAQPHGRHHTRHLLHLRVRDLVVLQEKMGAQILFFSL